MQQYQIVKDTLDGDGYELVTALGYSLDDGQHIAYADTKAELYSLTKEIKPCDCWRCRSLG
jgi:hypothetical protein